MALRVRLFHGLHVSLRFWERVGGWSQVSDPLEGRVCHAFPLPSQTAPPRLRRLFLGLSTPPPFSLSSLYFPTPTYIAQISLPHPLSLEVPFLERAALWNSAPLRQGIGLRLDMSQIPSVFGFI